MASESTKICPEQKTQNKTELNEAPLKNQNFSPQLDEKKMRENKFLHTAALGGPQPIEMHACVLRLPSFFPSPVCVRCQLPSVLSANVILMNRPFTPHVSRHCFSRVCLLASLPPCLLASLHNCIIACLLTCLLDLRLNIKKTNERR